MIFIPFMCICMTLKFNFAGCDHNPNPNKYHFQVIFRGGGDLGWRLDNWTGGGGGRIVTNNDRPCMGHTLLFVETWRRAWGLLSSYKCHCLVRRLPSISLCVEKC